MLAHIRLLPTAPRDNSIRGRHRRQSSDDLIEDLEYRLGSTKVKYLQVRIRYQHSGFSQRTWLPRNTTMDSIVSLKTMVETTAVAAIKRQYRSSLWSPRDVLHPNPLFEIIASYWGTETTSGVIHRILSSRSLPSNRGALNHPQSSQVLRLHEMSDTASGVHSISSGPEPTPIPRSETLSRIPRQTQSALTVRTEIKPTSRLAKTRTMESKSHNAVKPPPAPTRAAPPIPRRQTSLKIRAQTPRLSSTEENRGIRKQGTSQSLEEALPFLPDGDADSSENSFMQRAAAHAAGRSGGGADIHAHGSVTRNIQTTKAVVAGRPPSTASLSFSEACRVEDYQPRTHEQEEQGNLNDAADSVTPKLKSTSHSDQTNLDHSPSTHTPRSVGSTGSIIKNESRDANFRGSSGDNTHIESNPSFQRTNSLRTRSRPTELLHSSHPVLSFSSSVTVESASTRQERGNSVARPPPPPPPSPPIPGTTPSTVAEEHLSGTTSMSRTLSMTTRIASPADFDAMEFGLIDTTRRGGARGSKEDRRNGRESRTAYGYDGRHSNNDDDDPRDTTSESYDGIIDLGFTTQTLPSRYNRHSGGIGLHTGSGSGSRGFISGGIDRVRQVAGSGSGSVNGGQNNGRQGGRVAAATRYFNNRGGAGTGGGGSMNNRIGGGGVTTMGNNGTGTGSWRQRGLGNQVRGAARGTGRGERAARESSQDHEKEKQAGRWVWPSWW